ncbi:MAG: hypothetical protein QXW58_07180 [Thermosphaera sp.]
MIASSTVCYVVRERLWLSERGVGEENLWVTRVKIDDQEIDVEKYAIISFDPSTNPKEQEEVVVLFSRGLKGDVIHLGLPKDLTSLLESIRKIVEHDPNIIETIEVHIPREWLMNKCKVVVIGEESNSI